MPNTGASNVHRYCKAQNRVSASTEPVSTRMYQPSTKFSISMPQEVSRSAGNWKRKLRTWNGASITEEERRFMRSLEGRAEVTMALDAIWPAEPFICWMDAELLFYQRIDYD